MFIMSERKQIIHMQVRLVRQAAERWKLSAAETAGVFEQYRVFEYIRDCFGIFHVEGDEAIWEDLVPYLKSRGCAYA